MLYVDYALGTPVSFLALPYYLNSIDSHCPLMGPAFRDDCFLPLLFYPYSNCHSAVVADSLPSTVVADSLPSVLPFCHLSQVVAYGSFMRFSLVSHRYC